MNAPATDPAVGERLRADLEAIDGVRRAMVEGPPYVVWLVCSRSEPTPVEMLVRATLSRHGIDPGTVEVHLSFLATPQPIRRVRFLQARLERPAAGRAVASVSVEWAGEVFEETVQGESGEALELRLAALATLRTVEAVIGGSVRFRLLGIRSLRAFETDMVVVLLHTEHDPSPLIGVCLARESPYRSAAVAVLNATNRVLGNYLVTSN